MSMRAFLYEKLSLPPPFNNGCFIKIATSQQGFYFWVSFKRDFFVFGGNNETTSYFL